MRIVAKTWTYSYPGEDTKNENIKCRNSKFSWNPEGDTFKSRWNSSDRWTKWIGYTCFYTDPEASIMYGGPISPGAAWARLASDLGSWYLQGFGVWAIERKAQCDIVGTCGFWQGKGWPRELTWWLLPEVRGQGIAKEASIAAVAHAYSAFGWPEVQTYMNDNNQAARSLVLSLGGIQVARQNFPDERQRDLFRVPPPAPA